MTNRLSSQRGFVGAGLMDLAFLFVLILMGIGLWYLLSMLVNGNYAVAIFLLWLVAAAEAWWFSKDHRLVLRVPTGFLLFFAVGLPLAPLGAWSGSRLLSVIAAIAAVSVAKFLGAWWSDRIAPKVVPGAPVPWYLDQSINLIHDLFRWLFGCGVAWFGVAVAPLLLVFVLPPAVIPWAALVWGFAATVWYTFVFRKSRKRFLQLPLGLYAFAVTAVLLHVFRKNLAGALEPGSFEQIAYVAYWPVVGALFIEIVAVGTKAAKG